MSWRNQGITGSNNIPLGTRRRFGGDSDGTETRHEDSKDGLDGAFNGDRELKRGRSPEPSEYHASLWVSMNSEHSFILYATLNRINSNLVIQ